MSAARLPNTIWDDMPVVKYKRPAKLKKPKQAKLAGAKAVRAVRTWQLGTTTGPECRPYHAAKRAFVLPADAASVERMATQVAEAVADCLFIHGAQRLQLRDGQERDLGGWCRSAVIDQVKAASMKSLGITSTKGRQ